MSPNLPNDYPSNAYNIWEIRVSDDSVIQIHLEQLSIQEGSDHLYIGDGIQYFSTNSTRWIHLTGEIRDIWGNRDILFSGPSATVIFTSDGSINGFGFVMQISARKGLYEATVECEHV